MRPTIVKARTYLMLAVVAMMLWACTTDTSNDLNASLVQEFVSSANSEILELETILTKRENIDREVSPDAYQLETRRLNVIKTSLRAQMLSTLNELDSSARKGELMRFLHEANLARGRYRISLEGADFSGADLGGMNLSVCSCRGIDLSSADLTNVDMSRADLRDADLSDISYNDQTIWNNVRFNDNTVWPDGFDIDALGVPDE